MTTSRRKFLQTAALGAAALGLKADPLGLPIGCQTWPVRDVLAKDFDGTLKQLAGMGYQRIEMCSPPGYAKGGYGPLVGIKASDMKARIQAAGLGCESCHFQYRELQDNLDDRIAFAKELGLKQMVLSTFGLPADASMSDWSQAAHTLNKIAEQIHKAGLQAGFHNHNFEFHEIDGVLVYDKLMSEFDPKLIKMQFQVSVIAHGYEAATYFNKYPGRFLSIHLQDWNPTEKKEVAIGQGIVNWKKTFEAAKTGGVKNYFVELEMPDLQPSEQYLKALKS